MKRRIAWAAALVLGIAFFSLLERPAEAVITADFPLKQAITNNTYVVMAKVEKFDPEKKGMVLVFGDSLKKDKPVIDKMVVSFARPDEDAATKDHAEKMLKRVANDLPVVVFIDKRDKTYNSIGYINGTWFRTQYRGDDPAKGVWRFLYCEIYLRRTFKGTTEEMRQAIADDVAGKKDAPPTNPKEAPGFGPEVKSKDKGEGGARLPGGPVFAVLGTPPVDSPLLSVIPTVAIGGPLAILSMLFPTLFGKPKEIMQRYLALLTVVTINSTVYILQQFFENSIKDYWWGSPLAVWTFMAVVTVLGVVWAWRRHQAQATTAEASLPKKGEAIVFQLLSLVGLVGAPYLLGRGLLFKEGGRELLVFCAVVWSGTAGIYFLRRQAARLPEAKPAFPLEGVMLAGLAVASAWMAFLLLPASASGTPTPGTNSTIADGTGPEVHGGSGAQPQFKGVAWTFPHERSTMDSTPLVTDKHIFMAVKLTGGFDNYGKVYCLDRATSKEVWSFDDEGDMKAVFSTPCLADNRLYVGEGYHQDKKCKLYCLDAATGKKLWEFKTKSHTESSPCVFAGKVFIGAGDDGLYCLDAATGNPLWNFPNLHVDAAPAVVGSRVYCGSGVGDIHRDTAIFCVAADTGKEVWRVPTDLPVWGSPVVDGGKVFYGLGNGNFVEDADKPAGLMLCVDATNGQRLWSCPVPNGILNRAAVDRQNVYFTCRDGHCYAVDRNDGRLRWKKNLGSPVVTAPALVTCPHCGNGQNIYAVARDGHVFCLDATSGHIAWKFDVAKDSGKKPQLFSSPRVFVSLDGKDMRRRIYFGTGLETAAQWQAALYCLEDRVPTAEGVAAAPAEGVVGR